MELAHSSEGYPMPALSPVDEAGLMFLAPPPARATTVSSPRRSFTVTLRSPVFPKRVSGFGSARQMCDYSLHTFPNRLAADGEDLVVHRFAAGSLGLASPADLGPVTSAVNSATVWSRIQQWFQGQSSRWEAQSRIPAVCVPPGARLVVRDIPKSLQREMGVSATEEVVFVQTTAEVNAYRDAIRFPNCRQVLLQELREGQRVRVLSTGASELEPVEVNWSMA
jgi:hypothetical protein